MNMTQEQVNANTEYMERADLILDQEWLETNGLGGYASSTVLNCHTRKYHGLLVAANLDTTERNVLVSKFDETVEYGDQSYALSFHYYLPGVYVPSDESNILNQEFCSESNPKWIYSGDNFEITKELIMPYGINATLIKYSLKAKGKQSLKLKLRPLLAYRSFHHTAKENSTYNQGFERLVDGVHLRPYTNMPDLFIQTNVQSEFNAEPCWYKNFSYQQEERRGYDHVEDLASPGYFEIELQNNNCIYLSVSAEVQIVEHDEVWKQEIKRRKNLLAKSDISHKNNKFVKTLEKAAGDFVIQTKDNNLTIIAGYHWFGSWGRDTMISLPGLFLETAYQADFKKVIRHFLNFEKDGLIPNMIGKDRESSAYNSVDASLWMFWAVQQFALHLKKYDWIKNEFWEELKNIFNAYAESRSASVKCKRNGLLETGSERESLSWMDACLDGKSVIPRYGYLIEINALWYNAVAFVEELALRFNDPINTKATELKKRIEESYSSTFFNEEKGYLADYVRGGVQNLQVRPNQVLAISLPYSAVNDEIAVRVLAVVIEQLFTPVGLRTLSPHDPDYCGVYDGGTYSRDRAYHNGTVWPWLIGPLGDALFKLNGNKSKAKKQVKTIVDGFAEIINEAGIGSIAEICDGDFPHAARGCIAQAWSVAEVRRLLIKVS